MLAVRRDDGARVAGDPGRPRRAPLVVCVAVCLVIGGLAGCGSDDNWTGGLATPSPVPVTFNPHALPRGDTVPTGIVVDGLELILYFWGSSPDIPVLDVAWRDVATEHVGDSETFSARVSRFLQDGCGVQTASGAFFRLSQMCLEKDDRLIEFGAVREPADRITSADRGTLTEARFTRWSEDPGVTIFWLVRRGPSIPDDRVVERAPDGTPVRTEPLEEERYPLVTAYGNADEVLAAARLRGVGNKQHGAGA
jgi:hypothetical protein